MISNQIGIDEALEVSAKIKKFIEPWSGNTKRTGNCRL